MPLAPPSAFTPPSLPHTRVLSSSSTTRLLISHVPRCRRSLTSPLRSYAVRPHWRSCVSSEARDETVTPDRNTVDTSDRNGHRHGLVLRRDELTSHARNGRTVRLKRWTSLDELDISDENMDASNENDTIARVWLVIQSIRKHWRVIGRVRTEVHRTCDRCAQQFCTESDGRFEVVLIGDAEDTNGNKALEEEAEAFELFGKGVECIDLTQHVRDAVLLGVPTRALCDDGCVGVVVDDGVRDVSVAYGEEASKAPGWGMNAVEGVAEGELRFGADERLLNLKEKLEGMGR